MKNEGMRCEERRQIMHPGDWITGCTRERSTGTEEEQEHSFGRSWPQLHYRRRELHLDKQPCTPQRLSTIRTDFCPHTNWQICSPLLKASSTHPVITTCAHNTKQTSGAKTTTTNNTQNSKAKKPLLATAAVRFVILEDDGVPPSRLTSSQLSCLPKVQTSMTLEIKHHNKDPG